jgi:hypothetical protein
VWVGKQRSHQLTYRLLCIAHLMWTGRPPPACLGHVARAACWLVGDDGARVADALAAGEQRRQHRQHRQQGRTPAPAPE